MRICITLWHQIVYKIALKEFCVFFNIHFNQNSLSNIKKNKLRGLVVFCSKASCTNFPMCENNRFYLHICIWSDCLKVHLFKFYLSKLSTCLLSTCLPVYISVFLSTCSPACHNTNFHLLYFLCRISELTKHAFAKN